MSDITSLVTGLANGLNTYMGTQNRLQQQLAQKKQEVDYSEAAKERSQNNVNAAELQRQKGLADYKQEILPEVDAKTADSMIPGLGKMVDSYKAINGRNPDPETFKTIASLHPKAQGMQMVEPNTLGDLAQIMGADEATVQGYRNLKSPVPTGLATESFKKTMDKGLTEGQIFGMYKEIMPTAQGKDPSQLGEDWIKFKTGIQEPGKTPIATDEEFTKISGAVDQVVQKAMSDGKSPSQAVAIGSQVISKYDRKSKAKLLFRMTANMKQAQAKNQQAQDPNAQGQ